MKAGAMAQRANLSELVISSDEIATVTSVLDGDVTLAEMLPTASPRTKVFLVWIILSAAKITHLKRGLYGRLLDALVSKPARIDEANSTAGIEWKDWPSWMLLDLIPVSRKLGVHWSATNTSGTDIAPLPTPLQTVIADSTRLEAAIELYQAAMGGILTEIAEWAQARHNYRLLTARFRRAFAKDSGIRFYLTANYIREPTDLLRLYKRIGLFLAKFYPAEPSLRYFNEQHNDLDFWHTY